MNLRAWLRDNGPSWAVLAAIIAAVLIATFLLGVSVGRIT